MIRRASLAAALAFGLCASAAPAQPDGPPPGGESPPDASAGRARFSFANPSGIIAAELGQARIIREKGAKGVKEAFKYYVADDAVVFVPGPVNARAHWKKAGVLPIMPQRSPYGVWMSCDGSQAIVQGAWQGDGATGYFVSVWERQDKDGSYKWAMTREEAATPAAEAPEMLTARIARCRPRKSGGTGGQADGKRPPPEPRKPGIARDETLRWRWEGEVFVAEMWTGTGYEEVLRQAFPVEGAKAR